MSHGRRRLLMPKSVTSVTKRSILELAHQPSDGADRRNHDPNLNTLEVHAIDHRRPLGDVGGHAHLEVLWRGGSRLIAERTQALDDLGLLERGDDFGVEPAQ